MAHRTASERANDLFAAYVAIEDAQRRLDAEGNGWAAEALSDHALAARNRLLTEHVRSGNADMIAARILAHLMLLHPWPPTSETEWSEDEEAVSLPVLALVAERTTGKVRECVGIVLAAIGTTMPEAAPDAMAEAVAAHRHYGAAYAAADFDGAEEEAAWKAANGADPEHRIWSDPPPVTTPAGLREAIAVVLEDVDFVQKAHARVLARALEYLDGRVGA